MCEHDYTVIARAVRKMKALGQDQLYVADLLAFNLAVDNKNFDRQTFLENCEVSELDVS